jgi:hypothetical protein
MAEADTSPCILTFSVGLLNRLNKPSSVCRSNTMHRFVPMASFSLASSAKLGIDIEYHRRGYK